MDRILKRCRAAIILVLAAGVQFGVVPAFAEADTDTTVVSVGHDDAMAVASGVPDTEGQGDTTNGRKDAKQPENTRGKADLRIPSTNPDDANKHPAWRKREANKAIFELRKLKESMMQQGGQ